MKLNKYFLIGAMGLGLFACSDDLDGNGQDNGNKVEEGTTYVAFSLDFKNLNSRATTTGTEEGTKEEQTVTSAYVILADASGNFSKVISTDDIVTSDEGYYTTNQKFLFKTTAGNHDFYAVVNPDKAPTTSDNATTYFNTATNEVTLGKITADDKFMMSSMEKKTFYIENGVKEEDALAGTKGTANNYEIDVERVSAKVTVTCENPILTDRNGKNAGGTIDNQSTTFNLKNVAEMTYRMKQQPNVEIEGNTYTGGVQNVAVCFDKGAEDVFYRNASPAYCLENLHTNYIQGNTTYITLKTVFKPTKVVDCDATTVKELKDNDATTTSFYVVTAGDLAGNYLMAEDLTDYRNGKEQDALPAGVEAISSVYTDGECWFGPIWVGQDETNPAIAPITRNTWYNLQITGITLPGKPSEPEIDEDEDLEPDTNVAITLSIMPWNFVNREISLQ